MRISTIFNLYWPRAWYKTKLEKTFRNLSCNVIKIDFVAHKGIHAFSLPPKKPPISFMREAVDRHKTRHCGCYGGE